MSVDSFLVGAWASTEAFGNTALDWSEDVKAGKAELHLAFSADGRVTFRIEQSTKTYRHVLPPESSFTCDAATSTLKMHQDLSGLEWHYQREDDANLRLRLVGAKRFGRCNGVDVIYLRRVA